MRTPPLLADFIHARPCKPFCEKLLTLPSLDSFIAGFELAWRLSAEVHNDENERSFSCRTRRASARFIEEPEQ